MRVVCRIRGRRGYFLFSILGVPLCRGRGERRGWAAFVDSLIAHRLAIGTAAAVAAGQKPRHCFGTAAHEAPEGLAPAETTTTTTTTIDAGASALGNGRAGRGLVCATEVLPCPPSVHLLRGRRVGWRGLPVQEPRGHRCPASQQDHRSPGGRLRARRCRQAKGGGCCCRCGQ